MTEKTIPSLSESRLAANTILMAATDYCGKNGVEFNFRDLGTIKSPRLHPDLLKVSTNQLSNITRHQNAYDDHLAITLARNRGGVELTQLTWGDQNDKDPFLKIDSSEDGGWGAEIYVGRKTYNKLGVAKKVHNPKSWMKQVATCRLTYRDGDLNQILFVTDQIPNLIGRMLDQPQYVDFVKVDRMKNEEKVYWGRWGWPVIGKNLAFRGVVIRVVEDANYVLVYNPYEPLHVKSTLPLSKLVDENLFNENFGDFLPKLGLLSYPYRND